MNNSYWLRGIRGATTVERDDPSLISEATVELLKTILEKNKIKDLELITSIFFTATADLKSCNPAKVAREKLGMKLIPLMCNQEVVMDTDENLPKTIRVMVHVHTSKSQADIKHVFLGETKNLRPDLLSDL